MRLIRLYCNMSEGLCHMNFWLSVLKDTFSKVRMEDLPMEELPMEDLRREVLQVEVYLPEPAVCFYMLSAYFQSLRSERQGGSHFFLYVSFLKPFGNPNGAALMSTLNSVFIENRYISTSV